MGHSQWAGPIYDVVGAAPNVIVANEEFDSNQLCILTQKYVDHILSSSPPLPPAASHFLCRHALCCLEVFMSIDGV